MVWGLVITCAILFSCGIGFLLAERLKLPSRAASRAMHSMGRSRKDKPNPLTLLMRELSERLAGKLRLNDYRRAQLEADLRTGDMTQTPEQFVAENIVRAGTVAVLAIPVAFVSKFFFGAVTGCRRVVLPPRQYDFAKENRGKAGAD